jgi:FAD:protein FMN transferase
MTIETKIPTMHRFREEAMATHFEILIVHGNQAAAASASSMAFRELQRLESLISRYQQGSDIDRINHIKEGDTILISEECHECLRQAMEVQLITDGLFDVAAGCFMPMVRGEQSNEPASWQRARRMREQGSLILGEDRAAVICVKEGLSLDLGGIGKGFALEKMANLLEEHDCRDFMLSAGGSTILARGRPAEAVASWKTNLAGAQASLELSLSDEALAASGLAVKGSHILHRGVSAWESPWKRVWVKAPHAGLADALSTACFQMTESELLAWMSSLECRITVWVEDHEGTLRSLESGF